MESPSVDNLMDELWVCDGTAVFSTSTRQGTNPALKDMMSRRFVICYCATAKVAEAIVDGHNHLVKIGEAIKG